MGGGAHVESVMDRIVHNAFRIQMGGVNMRERMCEKRPVGGNADTFVKPL